MTDAAETTALTFDENRLLPELFGAFNRHLTEIEAILGVRIDQRGGTVVVTGSDDARDQAAQTLRALYARLQAGKPVQIADVRAAARMTADPARDDRDAVEIHTPRRVIEPRNPAQKAYIEALQRHELTFGIGPAGTGKTYIAVAAAMQAFNERQVDRIVLSRPAVEAGERLGFLPGDMKDKVDPYLRPLYDALNDMAPPGQVAKHIESGVFEVAPLAFMRGRTLANAFVVLDEAQNCTELQMKMFLTRLGENARMVITGDPSQVDLPPGQRSGLAQAARILEGVKGVAVAKFTSEDVVRHPLVARIIKAYDREDDSRRRAARNNAAAPAASAAAAPPAS